MKTFSLSLILVFASSTSLLCQDILESEKIPEGTEAAANPEQTADVSTCLQQEASTFYTCLGNDLISAEFFEAGGGISLSDNPNEPDGAPAEAAEPAEGQLSTTATAVNPTAYIDAALVWRTRDAGDRNNNGLLEIPVCWINPSEDERNRRGRELTEQAVRNTWEVHAPIRFTGWNRCQSNATGAVRISIVDENPRSYIGRVAASQSTSMWLNFSFNQWSPVCSNRQGRINWNNCVHSIAVHEFGHLLGYLHEHDRLFHGAAVHRLPADQLQQQIGACRRDGVTGPSMQTPASRPLVTVYDPVSVMNYCFNIYDHQVQLSSLDIAGLQRAYPQ